MKFMLKVQAERKEMREKGHILIVTLTFVFQRMCSQCNVVKLSKHLHSIIFSCLFLFCFLINSWVYIWCCCSFCSLCYRNAALHSLVVSIVRSFLEDPQLYSFDKTFLCHPLALAFAACPTGRNRMYIGHSCHQKMSMGN